MPVAVPPDVSSRGPPAEAGTALHCDLALDLGHHLSRSAGSSAPHQLGEQELLQAHAGLDGPPSVGPVDIVGDVPDLHGGHACRIALPALRWHEGS